MNLTYFPRDGQSGLLTVKNMREQENLVHFVEKSILLSQLTFILMAGTKYFST